MPAPTTKKLISIRVTGAGARDTVTIRNYTQGWKQTVKYNSSGEALYNPATDERTAADGEDIQVFVNGRLRGNGSGTIASGGVTIKFTGTVDTISQAVNL